MTETVAPTVSDVILAFKRAEEKAGLIAAMGVVRQFGAHYAATIPAAHYAAAIRQFIEMARGDSAKPPPHAVITVKAPDGPVPGAKAPTRVAAKSDQTMSDSDRIKAAWKKGRAT